MVARSEAGFTLVELMVTLAVLAILMVMAVPSFDDYFQKARVRGAADQITNLLARARIAAVKSNLPIRVRAMTEDADWCVGALQATEPAAWAPRPSTVETPCDCLDDSATCIVENERLAVEGSDIGAGQRPALDVSGFDFSYSPKLGGVSANGAPGKSFLQNAASNLSVTSTNGRYEVNVIVTPLGQSYVCIPTGKPAFFGYRSCP